MRVDHLDCGPMRPLGSKPFVAHVFLVDPGDGSGLILVDTGFGMADVANPKHRLGLSRFFLRPDLDVQHTAVQQLASRGIDPGDVAHIVLTHLDFDHAGGLSDFPNATVHTTAAEHEAAVANLRFSDTTRYRSPQFAHGPRWKLHEGTGDVWRDDLTGHEVVPGVTLVPLPGHSRGHAAVAVDAGERGLLVHAGDAAYDASWFADVSVTGAPLEVEPATRRSEQLIPADRKLMARNRARLRVLNQHADVTVVNAHDPRMLEGLQDVNMH